MSDNPPRLTHLTTWWDCLDAVHNGSPAQVREALSCLVERYRGAVERYLRAAVRKPDVVEDLFQEFALRLTSGAFRGASPERGRFRDYLRTVLINLVRDHRRKVNAGPDLGLPFEPVERTDEALFDASWTEELFETGWRTLETIEKSSGRPVHTALRMRADYPGIKSQEIAIRLREKGRQVSEVRVRQLLLEARTRFVSAVISEVASSLAHPGTDALAEELAALRLLGHPYFLDVLRRRTLV